MSYETDPLTGDPLPKSNKIASPLAQEPQSSPIGVERLTESLSDIKLNTGVTFEQERFCMAYIDTGKARDAYEISFGCIPSQKELKSFLDLPNVIKRVSEIYNQYMSLMQQSCQVDVDMLVRELEQARQIALTEREASAAVAATMAKAKLHGLMVDRKEISMKRPEDMTEAELRQVLGEEFEEDLKRGRAIEQRKD